jgi:hypothetical protein
MTDTNTTDTEPKPEYNPEEDHFCDGHVTYTEDVTISLSGDEPYAPIREVDAECEVCRRPLTVVVDVGPDWLKTIDRKTEVTLHEY